MHNTNQQISIFDPFHGLTKREQKRLKSSWAEQFSESIFSLIKEERFSVLYSDNYATRPNNPVNVYFGLLMLKEIFNQSDEEAIDSLIFDIRYQHALHTTSLEEQPISKNSLSNFRSLVYRYNEKHGIDLIQEEIESHAKAFTKLLNIDGRTIRMDSLMISSSCKKLSRLEIIFSCVERIIKAANNAAPDSIPEKFKVYLEEGHRNDTIYRSKDKDIDSKLKSVTADAIELYYVFKESALEYSDDFKLLYRMLGEQTKMSDGTLDIKESKDISSDSLQNPTDPDATYRKKGTKESIGYVGNIVETFDDDNKIILHYDLQKNIYSDQQFSDDTLNKLGQQENEVTALMDGAYYSEDLSNKATSQNIKFIPTNLVGRSQSAEKSGYENFIIDETKHEVIACQINQKPIDSRYKKGVYRAHFDNKICDQCPHKLNCPLNRQKKSSLLEVSETRLHRIKLIAQMGTKEYKELANKRAGVEGIPSVLRRRYGIDKLPVRGLVRSKLWLGFKISAINCKRLMKGVVKNLKDSLLPKFQYRLLDVFSFQRSTAVKTAA